MNLIKGILFGFIAQIFTFFQLQGQFKYEWAKNNIFLMACMGIPISLLFIYSVRYFTLAYDGQIWPSRLIGFGTGVIVFTFMSHYIFREPLTPKTLICLGLSILIILIQLFWRN
jgi:multidrug transporter EmrE-like cation transporter